MNDNDSGQIYRKREDPKEKGNKGSFGKADFSGELMKINPIIDDIDKAMKMKVSRPKIEEITCCTCGESCKECSICDTC